MRYIPVILSLMLVSFPIASAEIFIQNDQQYTDNEGYTHIVGEIKNDLNVPVNQIMIHASLHSESSQKDSVITSISANNIMPGMKAPFDVIVQDTDITQYELDIEYKVASPKSQVIGITASEMKKDGLGNIIVSGTIVNGGEITANAVSVIVTLYDEQGDVAAVSELHTVPDYLRASEETFFQVGIPINNDADIVRYSVMAESEEYAAVPEFPLGSGVLLVTSLVGYLALTKYWNRAISSVVAATDPR